MLYAAACYRQHLPAEWIAEAEERLRRTGRVTTASELEQVLGRFPGDIQGATLTLGKRARVVSSRSKT